MTDHHAIIPTEQFVDLQTMTNEERKVYDLVVRRFLAVLLPAFEYDQTVFTLAGLAGESFTAKGKIVKSQGWKEAYENLETDEEWEEADDLAAAPKEQTLPSVKKGDSMPVAKVTVTTGKTTPPGLFYGGNAALRPWKIRSATWKAKMQKRQKHWARRADLVR